MASNQYTPRTYESRTSLAKKAGIALLVMVPYFAGCNNSPKDNYEPRSIVVQKQSVENKVQPVSLGEFGQAIFRGYAQTAAEIGKIATQETSKASIRKTVDTTVDSMNRIYPPKDSVNVAENR